MQPVGLGADVGHGQIWLGSSATPSQLLSMPSQISGELDTGGALQSVPEPSGRQISLPVDGHEPKLTVQVPPTLNPLSMTPSQSSWRPLQVSGVGPTCPKHCMDPLLHTSGPGRH